jgi:hypothetical protein
MQCPSGFKLVEETSPPSQVCVSQRDNSIRMPLGSPPPERPSTTTDDLPGAESGPVYESFDNLKDLVDTLKPLRPPTAPASDLAIERKSILTSTAPNFLLIQVELAIVILCLLVYAFAPLEVAPSLVVLLLSVGVAVGIFLWK